MRRLFLLGVIAPMLIGVLLGVLGAVATYEVREVWTRLTRIETFLSYATHQ